MRTRRLPQHKQTRLDVLLDKNNDGHLTRQERDELEELVKEAEELSLVNAQQFASHQLGKNRK